MKRISSLLLQEPFFGRVIPVDARAMTAAQARKPLLEIKHRIGKPPLCFSLESWHTDAASNVVVGRWLSPVDDPFGHPPGSFSFGVWWKSQHLGAYRLHGPAGNLVGYRFDVCKDVRLSSCKDQGDSVEFCDLVVDFFLWPNASGELTAEQGTTFEDLDELDDFRRQGLVSAEDSRIVELCVHQATVSPHLLQRAVDEAIDMATLQLLANP